MLQTQLGRIGPKRGPRSLFSERKSLGALPGGFLASCKNGREGTKGLFQIRKGSLGSPREFFGLGKNSGGYLYSTSPSKNHFGKSREIVNEIVSRSKKRNLVT